MTLSFEGQSHIIEPDVISKRDADTDIQHLIVSIGYESAISGISSCNVVSHVR